jgi:hypothetical protein
MASENTDFNEAQVEAMLKRSPWHAISRRWVSFGGNGIGVRLNWVRAPMRKTGLTRNAGRPG